ncbi:nucleotidyltransferase family protein [Microbacterium sp. 2216-1]|uniref:nucleotidyltransferase family protein n=1 Tax=Microbacterium sp. 2216-1 TaxID=3390053 RepID=UPI00397607B7
MTLAADPAVGGFSLDEANELAHAQVAHVAAENGIRVLSIKGLVADRYRLRVPRVAADADVWVDPARRDDLCELLALRGWHVRREREVPSLTGQHSVTLIRDDWPNDIDAHHRFPGFFATDASVFERLWQSREQMIIANTTVAVPSRGASAVIAALHAVRYSKSERHSLELRDVVERLRDDFSSQERTEFFDVARVGCAQWVLRDLYDQLGERWQTDADEHQRRVWQLNRETVEDGATVSWLDAVRSAPLARKPAVILRAAWISRADIPRNDPDRLPTRREAWQHRALRWRRGFAALLRYARVTLR